MTAAKPASRRRVPDFFIVGPPKTGTTSLHAMLRAHPQIFMPELKEPMFLASDMEPRAGHEQEPRELQYPHTLEEYLALFEEATPEQRVGEASAFYLWSRTAAGRIAELQPDARMIAILREPASLLRSLHMMFLRWGVEAEEDLRQAMSLEADRRAGRHIPRRSHRPQLLQYAEHVRYVDQLRRYREHFPSERMLPLIYDDFRHDNEATVRRVLRFLEVDDAAPVEVKQVNVTTRTVRSWRAKRLLYSISKGQGRVARSTKATIKALTTRKLRSDAIRTIRRRAVTTEPPPPDERFTLELRRRFEPDVVALSEYLDRDLVSLWGYDKLG
ncbi:MAG TPA: sulfotransferase [Solirubrobacteraceae bacterium]|nr:sulfotransferase [Solirubrobacteraceae bacterium]